MPPFSSPTIATMALSRPLLTTLVLAVLAVLLGATPASAAQLGSRRHLGASGTGPETADSRSELYDALQNEPRETPVSRVAQAVKPAVVYIETELVQRVRTVMGVQRRLARGAGSGVVIHPTGYIVTNYHVVEGARQIRVSFDGDPQPYAARLMSFVREEDLALLKIEPAAAPQEATTRGADASSNAAPGSAPPGLQTARRTSFPTVRMGTSSDLMPGERVVAIGSPHGQTYTVSTGIISGLHRDVPVPDRQLHFRGLIQTDASINRGNSGGPLLNIKGELIGINTVMNPTAENIGFAIPVDRVRQVLTDILFPRASRIWLGLDVEQRAGGLVITRVWENGPASELGICEGDRIVWFGGVPVPTGEAFLLQKLKIDPGQVVTIGLQHAAGPGRWGETIEAQVTCWDEMNGSFFEDIGMTVTVAQLDRNRFLMVDRVRPGSSAAELGVQRGDVIPAIRTRAFGLSNSVRLSDKASLRLVLDRTPIGDQIEIDAYRDLNGDSTYQRDELLKGVLIR